MYISLTRGTVTISIVTLLFRLSVTKTSVTIAMATLGLTYLHGVLEYIVFAESFVGREGGEQFAKVQESQVYVDLPPALPVT